MPSKLDCVVIGAGLGGLSAAASLARLGRSVLLLEKHNVPGGYSTSFVRGRFEFEVALHELSGVGTPDRPGPMLEYLRWLGVDDLLEFRQPAHLYRSIFPGVDIRVPAGREAFEQVLGDAFPAERDGLHRFLNRLFALAREAGQLERAFERGEIRGLKLLSIPLSFPNCVRNLGTTYADVLHRDIQTPELRGVLSQLWGYFGLPPSRVSCFYFGLGLATYITQGASYPVGRSQMLAQALAEAVERHGGAIRYGTAVERILHDGDRVAGVVTDRQEEILCSHVISNTDPLTTCVKMMGEPTKCADYLNSIRALKIAPSTINVYLGVNAPPDRLGLSDHETFINRDLDIESHHRTTRYVGPPDSIAMTTYNAIWPEISPPGTSMVVLTALSYGAPWFQLSPSEYMDKKTQIASSMLDMASAVCPDLRSSAEVVEVSTPATNARYAGTLGGSIYGFEHTPEASVILRPSSASPMPNLHFTGAWAQPGGGFQPCIMSGRMAAAAVLSRKGGQS
jgi:prolycopene isomerase